MDVARILARDPAELYSTDVPQAVLETLQASKVREVHMIGPRGPAHAKFTTKELRELGELPGVEVIVPDPEADLDAFDDAGDGTGLAESDRRVRGNMVVIRKWAAGNASAPDATPAPADGQPNASEDGHARTLTIRFWLRPVEITGDGQATGLILERTRLDENGAFQGTGELETLDAQMVLRSVGYQSVPLDGVPFDERAAVVPNTAGRVLGPDGAPLPGEYVAGGSSAAPPGSSAPTSPTRPRPSAACSPTWPVAPPRTTRRCPGPAFSGIRTGRQRRPGPVSRRWRRRWPAGGYAR